MKMSRLARPDRRTILPIIVTPMKAATKQIGEKTQAYCVFSSPLKKYDRAMVLLLKRIITTAVGATTCTKKAFHSKRAENVQGAKQNSKANCPRGIKLSAQLQWHPEASTLHLTCLFTALLPSAAVPPSIPYLMIVYATTHKFEQGISFAAGQRVAHERGTGGVVGLPVGPCPVAKGRG